MQTEPAEQPPSVYGCPAAAHLATVAVPVYPIAHVRVGATQLANAKVPPVTSYPVLMGSVQSVAALAIAAGNGAF